MQNQVTGPAVKDNEENLPPGHVNSVIYAAGDSRVKGLLWGVIASVIGFAGITLGLKNKNTAQITHKIAQAITWPEFKFKEIASRLTKRPPPAVNTGEHAGIYAAGALGFIVNHLAQIPYFEAARRKIVKINARNEVIHAENVRLKEENCQLKGTIRANSSSTGTIPATASSEKTQAAAFSKNITPKTSEGFRQSVVDSQNNAKETGQPTV